MGVDFYLNTGLPVNDENIVAMANAVDDSRHYTLEDLSQYRAWDSLAYGDDQDMGFAVWQNLQEFGVINSVLGMTTGITDGEIVIQIGRSHEYRRILDSHNLWNRSEPYGDTKDSLVIQDIIDLEFGHYSERIKQLCVKGDVIVYWG